MKPLAIGNDRVGRGGLRPLPEAEREPDIAADMSPQRTNWRIRMRRCLAMLPVLFTAAACGSSNSTSSPAAPAQVTPTRVINVTGNLNFGQVTVGDIRTDGLIT